MATIGGTPVHWRGHVLGITIKAVRCQVFIGVAVRPGSCESVSKKGLGTPWEEVTRWAHGALGYSGGGAGEPSPSGAQ